VGKGYEKKARNLILVFGDQLNAGSAAFDGFDTAEDTMLMMEVEEEAAYIPQHKIRLAFFFSAMPRPKSYDGQIRHDHSGLSVCDPVTSASLKAFKRRPKA
jgi:deoxyribodipyrimidine photolyase-like uncharacterized protein